jgi:hypothetical protein
LAADIFPGSTGSVPEQLTEVNGKLFFLADDLVVYLIVLKLSRCG